MQVWDASSGTTLLTYTANIDIVTSVAWSPDGKRLASGSGAGDETVQVWDAAVAPPCSPILAILISVERSLVARWQASSLGQ